MKRLLLYIFILQSFFFKLSAQITDLKFERILPKDGLSHGNVNCILQDSEGYMWFGTANGLNRYDGYSYKLFEHDPYNTNSISDNTIRALYEDKSGALWIATKKCLNKYDKRSDTFTLYEHDPTNALSISDNDILSIYEDKAGVLWIGTKLGLNKYDLQNNTFTLYEHSPKNPKAWVYNAINTIYEDSRNNLWVGTNWGLSKFDRHTGNFTRYKHYTQTVDTLASVTSIIEDKSGVLWIGTKGDGLKQFNRETNTFKVYTHDPADKNTISSNRIFSLFEDSFGILWIGHQLTGLDRWDRRTGKISHHVYDENDSQTISDNTIFSIYEDRSKVLWLSTFVGGINKADLLKKKFAHYQHKPSVDSSLKHNFVMAIYQDRLGKVWVGNPMGLDQFDKETNSFKHYTYTKALPTNLSYNNAHCMFEDNASNLWIGLGGGGLKKFNLITQTVTSYVNQPKDTTSLPDNYVFAIYQDKSGTLWIGTKGGLCKFDPLTEKFTTHKHAFQHNIVEQIIEDDTGILWLATSSNGLVAFDKKDTSFTQYPVQIKNLSAVSNKTVSYIYKDQHGILWLSLYSGGLYSFDRETFTYTLADTPKGLLKILINGILEDSKGNLWLSTQKSGIYKYNPQSKQLNNYDVTDGLQGNEFNRALCKGNNGEMYFAGNNGFNIFHPDSLKGNPYPPQIAINGFKVFDKPRKFSQQLIKLPYNENFFSFDFIALSYALPVKNKYTYKLENFDKEWIQAGTRKYASYTNIDPGEYIFKVKAANHDGVWNEQGTSIKVIITPPWWKTWPAYISYGIVGILILYALRHYTIKQERLKNTLKLKSLESEKLQELDQMRSKFFTNISHEFRTPLTLILSPLEKLQNKRLEEGKRQEYYQMMKRNANRLLQLINQLLDISKLEAGQMKLEKSPGDIVAFLKAQVFSFLSVAESKNVKLSFHHAPDTIYTCFDKDKLEKIISNLLSNAFKFIPDQGEITVSVYLRNESISNQGIQIQVQDNGIGIAQEKMDKIFDRFYQADSSHTREYEGTGIGLALTKELVELHGGKISVSSKENSGTCFSIEWPFLEANSSEVDNNDAYHTALKSNFIVEDNTINDPVLSDKNVSLQPGGQNPLLLIVEDSIDVRTYIRSIFDDTYRIEEAGNGVEGLEKATACIPDLIISDWMMPKKDGVALCHQLKTDERTSHIPVILLTAKAAVENKITGLETGADDYITKPFHTSELITRVNNLILQRKKLREYFGRTFANLPTSASTDTSINQLPAAHLNPTDEKFMQRLINCIESNISRSDLNVEWLEKEIGMSYAQFYRKVKAVTDQTPVEFLRNYRLKKAALLLSQKHGNVSEVAYAVGFSNLSYFTKCFRQVYGVTPSEYNNPNKLEQV